MFATSSQNAVTTACTPEFTIWGGGQVECEDPGIVKTPNLLTGWFAVDK